MLVGKLAVLFSCRGVLLGFFMLADRVVVLRLMMVMRGRMMMSSRVVMVLTRWMFRCLCHLDALCMGGCFCIRRLGDGVKLRKPSVNCRNRVALLCDLTDEFGQPLRVSRRIFPFIQHIFADSGYAGEKLATATLIAVEIVHENLDQVGFAVNPRRCLVEDSLPGLGEIGD